MKGKMPNIGGKSNTISRPKFNRPAGAATAKSGNSKARKSFCVSKIENSNAGKKIILYGKTGMGKSSLAATAPRPLFICPDKGLDDLDHPLGKDRRFDVIPGVDTFEDVRNATNDHSLFADFDTIVYDEMGYIQRMCGDYCVENIKKEKGGYASSISTYGYGRGYEHVYNQLRLLQVDMDGLVELGKNVIGLCQLGQTEKVDASMGDYWFAHPDLYDKKNAKCVAQWVAWASYVFKIDWAAKEIDGKIGVASDQHAVFTKPEFSFEAKSRGSKFNDYPAVTFDHVADDSLWRILFGDDEDE